MSAVGNGIYWIRAIAQAICVCAGTVQNAQQLVWLGRAVAAACVVRKGGMSGINPGVEHREDHPLASGAGATWWHGAAVPNLIGANESGRAICRDVVKTFTLD